jgi:hypothetical protein
MSTAGNPIQDVGFVNQGKVPQSGGWYFALKHLASPPFLEPADFLFGSIILIGPSGF